MIPFERKAFWALAVCFGVLAACSPSQPSSFRDTSAPISATTRFNVEDFAGEWLVAASFGERRAVSFDVTASAGSEQLSISSDAAPEVEGTYRQGVPGQLISLTPGQEALVVMWVDDDFETAVIGTVSGSLGLVLDRDGTVPADRAKAVRDILDFYGWNVSQLQRTL